jgi:hypothetical protein
MDVQADQTGIQAEHPTIVFERPEAVTQGQLFSGPQSRSYADTDQIPAVPRQSRSRRPDRGGHALRITVALVAVIVLLAAAMLGLVKAGVINLNSTSPSHNAATNTPSTLPADAPLLTQTSTSASSASYSIPIAIYSVTVSTSTGRSWVSISPSGQRPAFAGIVGPGQSQHQIILGPGTVEVGAGGTTVTVTSGKHSQALKPPSAPFTYQLTPKT